MGSLHLSLLNDKQRERLNVRLWKHIDRTRECWVWRGTKNHAGYGVITIGAWQFRVHRVVYELLCGAIPDNLIVCHHCDNPPCCNPKHLFLGTDADNAMDRQRKGRGGPPVYYGYPETTARGEKLSKTGMTEQKVRKIRERFAQGNISLMALGREYSVSDSTIRFIVRRQIWKHVE